MSSPVLDLNFWAAGIIGINDETIMLTIEMPLMELYANSCARAASQLLDEIQEPGYLVSGALRV
jgi:hypothetical protein